MAKSNPARGANLAETYVDMFAEVLKRVNGVMNPPPAAPPPSHPVGATSEIFPLTFEG